MMTTILANLFFEKQLLFLLPVTVLITTLLFPNLRFAPCFNVILYLGDRIVS